MAIGRDLDKANRGVEVFGGFDQEGDKRDGEGEVAKVIGLELHVEAVLGKLMRRSHDTCIVD